MKIEFDKPDYVEIMYIYCIESFEHAEPVFANGESFYSTESAIEVLLRWPLFSRNLGTKAALIMILKLFAGPRGFYWTSNKGVLGTWGWYSLGRCKPYPIESNAVVIGPIETSEGSRGKGLAAAALLSTMNAIKHKHGFARFYIDTHRNNAAAQKTFAKAGFGPPICVFRRTPGTN